MDGQNIVQHKMDHLKVGKTEMEGHLMVKIEIQTFRNLEHEVAL